MSRKPLTKKTRFEVFKRDSFTCQYCGEKAPDVILHVDHIKPVAKKGSNNIMNLITSCVACNLGKKDIPLDDKSVVNKQRKQSEELQERREQIEMMAQWQEGLKDISTLSVNKIIDYIKKSIPSLNLNTQEQREISKLLKKHSFEDIYSAIDKGIDQYILYDENGNQIPESIQKFLSKINGIIEISKDPIKSKTYYIKGICKKRFEDCNDLECINLLKNYIQAFKDYGSSENAIIDDLNNEVQKIAKESQSWTQWCEILKKWTSDIKSWEKKKSLPQWTEKTIVEQAECLANAIVSFFDIYVYLCKPFNENIDDLERRYYIGTLQYVNDQVDTINSLDPDMSEFIFDYQCAKKYGMIDFIISQEMNSPFLFEYSQFLTTHIPDEINSMLNLPDYSINDIDVAYSIAEHLISKLKELKGEKVSLWIKELKFPTFDDPFDFDNYYQNITIDDDSCNKSNNDA